MMWMRNLLFIGLVGGGLFAVGYNLMPPRAAKPVTRYDAAAYADPEFRAAVDRVDASFRQQWTAAKLNPAKPAPDLPVARRLALGLMGTMPSLEEIRQFETLPQEQRLPWWIDHLLQDRRFADYFAERLARAYVGTEDGPFILYRRRRFVSWLADQAWPTTGPTTPSSATSSPTTACGPTSRPPISSASPPAGQAEPARPGAPGRPRHPRLPRPPARLRPVPQPPLRRLEKGRFRGPVRLLRPDARRLHRHLRRRRRIRRGGPQDAGKRTVEPRVPFAPELLPDQRHAPPTAGRLGHASEKSRIFARAAVNRVWALLFGRPLVDPVDNLESNDRRPAGAANPGRRLHRPRLRPAPPDPRHRQHRGVPARQRRRRPTTTKRKKRPGPSSR